MCSEITARDNNNDSNNSWQAADCSQWLVSTLMTSPAAFLSLHQTEILCFICFYWELFNGCLGDKNVSGEAVMVSFYEQPPTTSHGSKKKMIHMISFRDKVLMICVFKALMMTS